MLRKWLVKISFVNLVTMPNVHTCSHITLLLMFMKSTKLLLSTQRNGMDLFAEHFMCSPDDTTLETH